MGKLILVRHGKTVLNSLDSAERLRGWLDVPLDEQGLREAEETAQRLSQHPVAHIYSSDLYRAQQTANAVVKATLAPIVHTSDLRPWNVGSLAGQRVQDILPILRQLELDPSQSAPEGESFLQFCDRYLRKLEELLDIAHHTEGCIVAVTHVRNLLAAPTLLHGGNKSLIPVKGGPKTGSLVWVEKNGEGWNLRVDEAPEPVEAIAGNGENAPASTMDLAS
ncbi:MAG: histidine phosphatase family protein [Candidatus Sulfotelmatobacter sp.]|jgi:broad specificity phosphatase PhoE